MALLSLYQPRLNACSHKENGKRLHRLDQEKSDQLQNSSNPCSGENQSIDEKENQVLMQTELRLVLVTL